MSDTVYDLERNKTTIGLLGCDVSDLVRDGSYAALACMNGRRLGEIERHILNIEEQLRVIAELVQP